MKYLGFQVPQATEQANMAVAGLSYWVAQNFIPLALTIVVLGLLYYYFFARRVDRETPTCGSPGCLCGGEGFRVNQEVSLTLSALPQQQGTDPQVMAYLQQMAAYMLQAQQMTNAQIVACLQQMAAQLQAQQMMITQNQGRGRGDKKRSMRKMLKHLQQMQQMGALQSRQGTNPQEILAYLRQITAQLQAQQGTNAQQQMYSPQQQLVAPPTHYQPPQMINPQRQVPMSYYTGPGADFFGFEVEPERNYLPMGEVKYLPPQSSAEAKHRFEEERKKICPHCGHVGIGHFTDGCRAMLSPHQNCGCMAMEWLPDRVQVVRKW